MCWDSTRTVGHIDRETQGRRQVPADDGNATIIPTVVSRIQVRKQKATGTRCLHDAVSGVAWLSDVTARGNQTEGRRLHHWQATPNQRQAKASPGRWCRVNVGFFCDGRRVAIPASVVYPSISPFIRRTHGSCTTHVTPHDAMRLKCWVPQPCLYPPGRKCMW